jgi:hypothetical protein
MKVRFTRTDNDGNVEEISMNCSGEETISELTSGFERFLRACGYHFHELEVHNFPPDTDSQSNYNTLFSDREF